MLLALPVKMQDTEGRSVLWSSKRMSHLKKEKRSGRSSIRHDKTVQMGISKKFMLPEDPVASGSNVQTLVASITSGRKLSYGMPSDFGAPANSAYKSSRRSAIFIPMLLEGDDLPVYYHDRELFRSLLPGGLVLIDAKR
jgi:hypothetical protein